MIEKRSIEELLELVKVEDVVGQFCTLSARAGANRKADACPFCGVPKKFGVNIPKQIYKCHDCGEGSVGGLKFLMHAAGKKTGKVYLEAIQWLADFYKVELKQVPRDGAAADSGDTFDQGYFHGRMEAIRYKADRPEGKGLFRPRTDGGIEIRYPNLYAAESPWQQHKGADFVRVRLHPSRVTTKGKYHQPEGSGIRIFIPPVVVAEHRANVQWETLYVVEGEFKSFAMAAAGFPVVGIGGIQLFIAKQGQPDLHADLVQLLRNTKCVCMVHDADATTVKWDPDKEPDKDLGKRLRDFARSVTGFRRSVGSLVPSVYYAYIQPDWAEKAKGLDDLAEKEGVDRVSSALQSMHTNSLFKFNDITKAEWRQINDIFELNLRSGVPTRFYRRYNTLIGERVFTFCGGRYQYQVSEGDDGEGSVQLLEHPESKNYVAVGCDFYKRLSKLDENKRPQPYLKPWSESNLMRNYVRKGVPNFLHTLDTYDDFTVVPGHHEEYQPTVVVQQEEFGPRTRLLNKYFPLDVQPREGTYPVIVDYLKHVFGTHTLQTKDRKGVVLAESEAWVVYLDRWTIMYREPYRRVPAVVLGNEKRNTGKSTLLWLNLAMWGGNGVVIGNNAITDNFNADWIDCSYVGVDETSIDKKQDGEKLKAIMTAPVSQRRGMYKDREKSINFTKFDFTTNDPDKFLQISEDEMRYWVNIVPQYTSEDPDLLQKMIKELPALFHDLRTRAIVHPRVGRLWFADSVIDNEARRAAAAQSKSWIEKEFTSWIQEQFYSYRWPELYFTQTQVKDGMNNQNGARFRLGEVGELLQKKLKCHNSFCWVTVPNLPEQRKAEGQSTKEIGKYLKQRWWIFRASDWIDAKDAQALLEEAKAEWAGSVSSVDAAGNPEEFKLHHPK